MNEEQVVVKCDKSENVIDRIQIKHEILNNKPYNGMKVDYFSCPVCGYKYPIVLVDHKQYRYHSKIVRLQKRVEILNIRGKSVDPLITKQLNGLYKMAKEHQATLRDTYLTAVTDQLNKSDT